MEFSVNAEEVSKNINKLIEQQLPEVIRQALEDSCNLVEAQAKVNAPVRDGQLVQSIKHEVDGNIGTVYSDVEYAPYQEVGTGIFASMGNGRTEVPWRYRDAKGEWHTTYGTIATHFMQDAMDQSQQRIMDTFRSYFK